MPRTPKDAGLIGVALKRKKEFKNTHKHQLIDPNKLFKMLNKLKEHGNKYYQFYDDFNDYQTRCKEDDPNGYEVMFKPDNDVLEEVEVMNYKAEEVNVEVVDEIENEDIIDDDNDIEQKDNTEYETKDPVKKYQFEYNKSLCMTDKYPEISLGDRESISVAPGEGKIPKDIMGEEDWDIKAFPHLNNPDGSNGKDQDREVKIRDQYFFIQ